MRRGWRGGGHIGSYNISHIISSGRSSIIHNTQRPIIIIITYLFTTKTTFVFISVQTVQTVQTVTKSVTKLVMKLVTKLVIKLVTILVTKIVTKIVIKLVH